MSPRTSLKVICLLLAASLLIPGCTSLIEKREKYLANHPGIPTEFKQAISEGKVLKKMTHEMVEVAWGDPMTVAEPADTSRADEVWVYGGSDDSPSTCLCFKNGLVEYWEQPCSIRLLKTGRRQPGGAPVAPMIDDRPPEPLTTPTKGEPGTSGTPR